MRICSLRGHRLKQEWNQMVWSVNNLRCGTADPQKNWAQVCPFAYSSGHPNLFPIPVAHTLQKRMVFDISIRIFASAEMILASLCFALAKRANLHLDASATARHLVEGNFSHTAAFADARPFPGERAAIPDGGSEFLSLGSS